MPLGRLPMHIKHCPRIALLSDTHPCASIIVFCRIPRIFTNKERVIACSNGASLYLSYLGTVLLRWSLCRRCLIADDFRLQSRITLTAETFDTTLGQ